MATKDDLHFRLRIPEDLKKRVDKAASENDRSMTAEINARLRLTFDADDLGYDEDALTGVALQQTKRVIDDLRYQFRVLEWMEQQHTVAVQLLEAIAATDGNVPAELMDQLRGILARRGSDGNTAFPEMPKEG